jgi:glycosyltransferase involved in cell wall biosynthesis
MRILIALTYYRPHYSGLTIYTERLARALAARGHRVTVITSRFDSSLPAHEIKDGVEIIRPRVMMRISKGVIMPTMWYEALKVMREADVISLQVPQVDAAYLSVMARVLHKPVFLTYHCDLYLPKGFIHWLANQVSHVTNHISALAAQKIVTNTQDYAEHSQFLKHYLKKVRIIPPPIELAATNAADMQAFRYKYGIEDGQQIIGMAARLATEKGVEYVTAALPGIMRKYPQARVLFVGQYQKIGRAHV